jgi:hypothetical protein
MKPPKSSIFSFGKKEKPATPPAAPGQAAPLPAATLPAAPLSFDDLLKAVVAGVVVKEAVPQHRFNELLERARGYAKGH